MAVNYNINKEIGFISVVVNNDAAEGGFEKFFVEIPKIAHESRISKILVDCRLIKNPLSTMKRFEYATGIAKHFRGIKVAFVADIPLRDPELFGELVATNRGADIRVCVDIKEAYFWLDIEQEKISSG